MPISCSEGLTSTAKRGEMLLERRSNVDQTFEGGASFCADSVIGNAEPESFLCDRKGTGEFIFSDARRGRA